jgi:hypothetical protein
MLVDATKLQSLVTEILFNYLVDTENDNTVNSKCLLEESSWRLIHGDVVIELGANN